MGKTNPTRKARTQTTGPRPKKDAAEPVISRVGLLPEPTHTLRRCDKRTYEVALFDPSGRRIFNTSLAKRDRFRLASVAVDPRLAELLSVDEDNLEFGIHCRAAEPTVVTISLEQPQRTSQETKAKSQRRSKVVKFPGLFSYTLNQQDSCCCVCIDAGHGGKDPGTAGGEAELNQNMANLLHDEIMKIECCKPLLLKATLSPNGKDAYAFDPGNNEAARKRDLRKRPQLCEDKGCKGFFISIHHNSAEDNTARGTETYYFDPDQRLAEGPPAEEKKFIEDNLKALRAKKEKSKKCAEDLAKCISDEFKKHDATWKNRGAKADDLTVIERGPTDMPAVLVELGFLSNAADAAALNNKDVQRAVAKALADCICKCCRENR